MSSVRLRSKYNAFYFLLPALLFMLVLLLFPVISGVRLSLFNWKLVEISKNPQFIGFQNYLDLFKDEIFWESVKVTLLFTSQVVIIEVIVGLFLAILLEEGIKGIRFFRTLFVLPIMIAPVVVGVIWRFLYNPTCGKINYFITSLGFSPIGWLSDPKVALAGVIISDVWQWTPFVFLMCLAALENVPAELYEAAKVDGASYWQIIFKIKLPCIASVISIAAVLRLIDAFRSLEVIFNLTNGGPGVSTEILSLHLYKVAFVRQHLGMASAIGVILLIMILILSTFIIINNLRTKENR